MVELKKELKNLSIVEKKIINARLSGLSFSEQEKKDLQLSTDQIILRCSAIYGCEMPYTDIFANILSEQIISFVNGFLYEELTLAEIILAMEINLPQTFLISNAVELDEVAFSGRCVNVSFLSRVLKNYKALRNSLDRKIQNHIDGYQQ